MLNFLGNLFENKYEYSTINSYRSAISAYHNLVEGKSVGQHISVCNLMTGVFNKNPPKPKYTSVRDVEKILKYIKTVPTNRELSDRMLLLKLTSLLFLTSAGRFHEICHLDIRYMVKTFSSYKFHFSKLTKSWKKGKAPPCLELRAYCQGRDSCVMTCLEVYLKRSNSWREKGQTQLLLSHLKPHKEIQKSTLAGWVKIVLRKAGIDTSQFKAHSCRSVATSKAKAMDISLEGVLKRG